MKKTICIVAIVGTVIIAQLLLACLGAIIGENSYPFSYRLGAWMAQPYMWLISIGIALLLRSVIYKSVFKTKKDFSRGVSYALMGIGIVWGAWRLAVDYIDYKTSEHLIESYTDDLNKPMMTHETDSVYAELDDYGNTTVHKDSSCKAIHDDAQCDWISLETATVLQYNKCGKCYNDSVY